MKRRFSLVLAVVLAVALVAVIPFATGAFDQETQIGDVEEGYTPAGTAIHNADEFAKMEPNGSYYLARNIEITATYAADFTGKLDGNGKIVTTTVPLFKNLKGEVKNLKITGTVSVSDYDTGALAQRADGATVTNVLNHANVTGAKAVISEEYAFTNVSKVDGTIKDTARLAGTAGIVGSATGVCSFTDCMNLGAINGSPAGGIVGVMGYAPNDSSFTFVSCYNEGKITDNGCSIANEPNPQAENRGVAGIAGFAIDAKTVYFENCHNKGAVDCSYAAEGESVKTTCGGIFGHMTLSVNTTSNDGTLTVKNCTNEAAVKGSGQTGGIVGYNGRSVATIIGCTNKETGTVESTNSYCGGITARVDCDGSIIKDSKNYASSIVSGNGNTGGICGYTSGVATFDGCINYADLYSNSASYIAGILGSAVYDKEVAESGDISYIKNCKNYGDITSENTGVGGIVANHPHAYIENCLNEGNVRSVNSVQVGGIIGRTYFYSEIKNCTNTGTITARDNDGSGRGAIGGIAGYVNTSILVEGCKNTGTVSCVDEACAGIVGNVNVNISISGCENTGNVSGTANNGGIVGRVGEISTITNCKNSGNVTNSGQVGGGIVGYAVNGGTISGCSNSGTITVTGNYAGGIAGSIAAAGTVTNCSNSGSVSATGQNVGGISGYIKKRPYLENCVNTGDVSGSKIVGGLVGWLNHTDADTETIIRCGNEGNISASVQQVGGFAGYIIGGTGATTIQYCYNTGNVTAPLYVGGAIGYISSSKEIINVFYCFFSGVYTATGEGNKSAVIDVNNNEKPANANKGNNYYVSGVADFESFYSGAADKSVASNPNTTAAAIASGELAYTLNAAIKAADPTITADVFYQTIGTDKHPVLDNTHKAVLKLEDGTYANELPAPPVEPEDTTTEEETTTETPSEPEESTTATPSEPEESTTETPSEPEESTTAIPSEPEESTTAIPSEPEESTTATPSEPEETTTATPFEPDGPIVGDSIATVIIVVAIAVVAIASTVAFVVIKKKEN